MHHTTCTACTAAGASRCRRPRTSLRVALCRRLSTRSLAHSRRRLCTSTRSRRRSAKRLSEMTCTACRMCRPSASSPGGPRTSRRRPIDRARGSTTTHLHCDIRAWACLVSHSCTRTLPRLPARHAPCRCGPGSHGACCGAVAANAATCPRVSVCACMPNTDYVTFVPNKNDHTRPAQKLVIDRVHGALDVQRA